jgi:hypothetical protein
MSRPRGPHFLKLRDGYANSFQQAVAFHLWWQSKHGQPTWQEIASYWEVDRSTAYRWRDGYLAAIGRVSLRAA